MKTKNKQERCTYTIEWPGLGYETGCKKWHSGIINGWKFCPFCSKRIKEIVIKQK